MFSNILLEFIELTYIKYLEEVLGKYPLLIWLLYGIILSN